MPWWRRYHISWGVEWSVVISVRDLFGLGREKNKRVHEAENIGRQSNSCKKYCGFPLILLMVHFKGKWGSFWIAAERYRSKLTETIATYRSLGEDEKLTAEKLQMASIGFFEQHPLGFSCLFKDMKNFVIDLCPLTKEKGEQRARARWKSSSLTSSLREAILLQNYALNIHCNFSSELAKFWSPYTVTLSGCQVYVYTWTISRPAVHIE